MKKLCFIALNEFSVNFLERASKKKKLKNINKLLSSNHSKTWTEDAIERRGLDPWVQWVSIHTGVPSTIHKIRHLGDIPNLSTPQIWEKLSEKGLTSGVWGAMNANRNNARQCKFFLPDPWTYSENGYPKKLDQLLSLPRYYSRNYLDTDKTVLAKSLLQLLFYTISQPSILFRTLKILPISFKGILKFGLKNHVLFSIFDLVSTQAFLHNKRISDVNFSLLFLNSIAHVQHNIWSPNGEIDEKCYYSVEVLDKILELIYSNLSPGEELVVMNSLSQINIAGEKNHNLYRQINPDKFLNSLNINYTSIEQLMTNDGHIIFNNIEEAVSAKGILSGAMIAGKEMFDVEYTKENPHKLFFQLDFWDSLPQNAVFVVKGKSYQFYEYFEKIVTRTGEHIQDGDIYCSTLNLPNRIYNHEIHNHIEEYFAPS